VIEKANVMRAQRLRHAVRNRWAVVPLVKVLLAKEGAASGSVYFLAEYFCVVKDRGYVHPANQSKDILAHDVHPVESVARSVMEAG
jgi:hypothetical protein